jgi:hypothetical protein
MIRQSRPLILGSCWQLVLAGSLVIGHSHGNARALCTTYDHFNVDAYAVARGAIAMVYSLSYFTVHSSGQLHRSQSVD